MTEPSGPNKLADTISDELDDIASRLDGSDLTKPERKRLSKQKHRLEGLLRWCKSRAGYVA